MRTPQAVKTAAKELADKYPSKFWHVGEYRGFEVFTLCFLEPVADLPEIYLYKKGREVITLYGEQVYEIIEAAEKNKKQRTQHETEPQNENESCWVYLMHDLANNAYKIGISNNPEYRERTLQSEKPTIEKVAARQFPTRAIAKAFESSLHKVYAMRHMRGEWFMLEPNEVEDVKKALE